MGAEEERRMNGAKECGEMQPEDMLTWSFLLLVLALLGTFVAGMCRSGLSR